MAKTLHRVFHIGFSLLWGWLFLNSVLRWRHNGAAALAAGLVLAAVFFLLAKFAVPRLDRLAPKAFRLGFGIVFSLYTVLFCWFAWLLAVVPIMDLEAVLHTLPDLLENGRFGVWNAYYVICNNNLGLALVLGGWYRLASLFGFAPGTDLSGVAPGIALNALAILGSVALVCLLARRLFHSNGAVALAFLLCAGFAPFVLYAPTFYSDTLSLPFALLALLAWTYYRAEARPGRRLALLAGMAAAAFLGYAVKGSVVVVVAALVIQLFLEKRVRQAAKGALALVLCFALFFGSYRAWQRLGFIDWTEEDALGLPLTLWFCYGSHDEGNYSQADYEAAMSVPTLAQRKALLSERLWRNYRSYSPSQLGEFLTKKAAITWGDGLYDAQQFLATPQRANWTHRFILEGQPGYMPLVYYCQAYLYMLQLLLVAGAALAAVKNASPGPLTLARLCVLGLVLFLSFWETKARYAFNFTPLLLLLALASLLALAHRDASRP
ncbi:glycosyltransferase family 39 protein [Allofournierella sp.]|uniref:glycosyltransferase family 39 protein n=1 Tax=Allofournierella sp. TaxID=1940256 RepID=UPI003AB8D451